MIMNRVKKEKLPDEMLKKIEELYLDEYYDLLYRNLGVLINRQ